MKVLPSITISDIGLDVILVVDGEFCPGGSSVNVKPTEVRVVGAVTLGKEIVADPTIIPSGPSVTTCPSGSVIISEEAGKLNVDPPMTIPPGPKTREDDIGNISVVPGIVSTDPFGSVNVDGGIVVTNRLCPLQLGRKVSVLPETVVNKDGTSAGVLGLDFLPVVEDCGHGEIYGPQAYCPDILGAQIGQRKFSEQVYKVGS